MKSIRYLIDKIKLTIKFIEKDDIFFILLIIFVGIIAFGLGRLSKIEENITSLQIDNSFGNTAFVSEFTHQNNQKGKYVVSKLGTKYHLPWCSGALRISEENKIWFETKEEAENKGYTPAKNCKGI